MTHYQAESSLALFPLDSCSTSFLSSPFLSFLSFFFRLAFFLLLCSLGNLTLKNKLCFFPFSLTVPFLPPYSLNNPLLYRPGSPFFFPNLVPIDLFQGFGFGAEKRTTPCSKKGGVHSMRFTCANYVISKADMDKQTSIDYDMAAS